MNASVVNTILERSQGCCEAMLLQSGCNGRGEHIHHRRLRSQGGGDTATNCVHICHKCHDYIHRNTGDSYHRGLLCRSYWEPDAVPVEYRGILVLLNPDGTYIKQCEGGFYAER
nr:MAG TPA: CRISPR-associated endonuclease [Caudoviricetes sp.]